MFPWNYPYISVILLIILIYAGFEDFRKRKITTITFLVFDVLMFFYYVFFNFWLALFLIPILSEFFLGRFSLISYVVLILPVVFDPSIVTISIAYSILLVKSFGIINKNLGRGDVKALQAISVALPFYPHLPLLDSLFPPVLAITLVASVIGITSSIVITRRKLSQKAINSASEATVPNSSGENKFWVKDSRVVYKIPLVSFICIAYAVLLILSSLQLV
ncbi:MAG: hypothetical protein ACP5UZ_01365 [Thermoplasmata archaeon]